VSGAMLGAFFVLEGRLKNPIMPLRIFRLRSLTGSSVLRGLLASGMFSTFFLGALYLERVLHFDPLKTGLAFLPVTLVVATLSTGITARLVSRFGAVRVLIPGMLSMIAGLLLLAHAGEHAQYLTDILPAFLLVGFGGGTAFMPLLTIAMAEVPHADAGLGSGIVNVSQQMAAAVGLAVLGTLATNRTGALRATGHSTASALTSGYHLAFLVGAGCVVLGVALSPLLLRGAGAFDDAPALSDDERRELDALIA
jgi:MFS family permease